MTLESKIGNWMIEGAELRYPNFAGRPDKFNAAGTKSFGVYLPEELVQPLIDDNWNVKFVKDEDVNNPGRAYINVGVNYKIYPPAITMVTSTARTLLDEDTVGVLDDSSLVNVDLIVRPYIYDFNGEEGIKAMVKTMFATIDEDFLMRKYATQDVSQEDAF